MNRQFFVTALAVLAVVLLAFAAWQLVFVLLLTFAAVLLAVLLHRTAAIVSGRTSLGMGGALGIVIVGFFVLVGGFLAFAGPRIAAEVALVFDVLPQAWDEVQAALGGTAWGGYVLDGLPFSDDGTLDGDALADGPLGRGDLNLVGVLEGTVSTTLGAIINIVVVLTVAIYLALDPRLYRSGVMHLVPRAHRDRAGDVLAALGQNLWRWLLGQSMDMLAVAVMTAAGLWLLGVPLPIALGVIAGVTNFIPYLGPFIGAAPAVVIAFAHDPILALYVGGLFVVVQQVDAHVLMPIIQKRAASMPPALTILVVVAAGALFGLLGVLLATPMLLVILTLVQMLYVEDALDDHGVEEGVVPRNIERDREPDGAG